MWTAAYYYNIYNVMLENMTDTILLTWLPNTEDGINPRKRMEMNISS